MEYWRTLQFRTHTHTHTDATCHPQSLWQRHNHLHSYSAVLTEVLLLALSSKHRASPPPSQMCTLLLWQLSTQSSPTWVNSSFTACCPTSRRATGGMTSVSACLLFSLWLTWSTRMWYVGKWKCESTSAMGLKLRNQTWSADE